MRAWITSPVKTDNPFCKHFKVKCLARNNDSFKSNVLGEIIIDLLLVNGNVLRVCRNCQYWSTYGTVTCD